MARRAIRFSIFGLITILLLRGTIIASVRIYRAFFPAPPPPPTLEFGVLPTLPFPEQERRDVGINIETPDGTFPALPAQIPVYFMPQATPNLFSLETTQRTAQDLGFIGDGEEVSSTLYRFRRPDAPSTLEINIGSGVFSISYDLAADPSVVQNNPPAPEASTEIVTNYLRSANLLAEDLSGTISHNFLKIQQGNFVPALALADADVVKVNLFRKSFGDEQQYPSVTTDSEEANVWFIVTGSRQQNKEVIAGEYHYFPIDEQKLATYPIKTAATAWEEFTSGGGYIASYGQSEEDPITVRRVYLGYYDPGVPFEFYEPVIIFEGDKGFKAYVPAITAQYYGLDQQPGATQESTDTQE